ncbi:alpha/beta fold hydrolase [Mucilaginibacter sp. HD30]
MSKIFLIAGMGADTRIYNNIELPDDDEVIPVDWIEPDASDTLATYSQRLIKQHNITYNSIVIGNSLGGMMAIEIGKLIPLNKVILISSIKTIDEAPPYFSFFKMIPLYRIVPGKVFTHLGGLIRPVFGGMSAQQLWLFKDMLSKTSPGFLKWAMGAVLKWKNKTIPPNVYHITGDNDRVFNYRLIKGATIVKGGTHIMIFDKAKEINKILKGILRKK